MKFKDLPIGAQFKLWPRGRDLIKRSTKQFAAVQGGPLVDASPEVAVIPAEVPSDAPATAGPAADPKRPWGPSGPLVDIQPDGEVVLEGKFAPWQLESIQIKLRARKK